MSLGETLASGATHLCRCWSLTRRDGVVLGFTDHDTDLSFAGQTFRAATGLSARALVQGTGLAVDNSEGLGALSSAAITAADIAAGRYDGAQVTAWLVNWQDPGERLLRFSGSIGEIREGAGAFHAELRGMSDLLGKVQTRSYQTMCPAVLGDAACGFDLSAAGFSAARAVIGVDENRVIGLEGLGAYAAGWFERGALQVNTGAAAGLAAVIKRDLDLGEGARSVELWAPLALELAPGDEVAISAGCDKRAETCQEKFSNFNNFRGFPHVPGEDWLMAVPKGEADEDGGSLT